MIMDGVAVRRIRPYFLCGIRFLKKNQCDMRFSVATRLRKKRIFKRIVRTLTSWWKVGDFAFYVAFYWINFILSIKALHSCKSKVIVISTTNLVDSNKFPYCFIYMEKQS